MFCRQRSAARGRDNVVSEEGAGAEGTRLNTYAVGPVFSLNGAKILLYWDSLRLVELIED
jgi:hypothetical protein